MDNIERSLQEGIWATQKHNEERLNEAFHNSDNVYLVFSVNSTGHFQGYARMASPLSRMQNRGWAGNASVGNTFRVEWQRVFDLGFHKTQHLSNPLNEGKPIKISRDGQELPADIGEELLALFDREADLAGNKRPGAPRVGPGGRGPLPGGRGMPPRPAMGMGMRPPRMGGMPEFGGMMMPMGGMPMGPMAMGRGMPMMMGDDGFMPGFGGGVPGMNGMGPGPMMMGGGPPRRPPFRPIDAPRPPPPARPTFRGPAMNGQAARDYEGFGQEEPFAMSDRRMGMGTANGNGYGYGGADGAFEDDYEEPVMPSQRNVAAAPRRTGYDSDKRQEWGGVHGRAEAGHSRGKRSRSRSRSASPRRGRSRRSRSRSRSRDKRPNILDMSYDDYMKHLVKMQQRAVGGATPMMAAGLNPMMAQALMAQNMFGGGSNPMMAQMMGMMGGGGAPAGMNPLGAMAGGGASRAKPGGEDGGLQISEADYVRQWEQYANMMGRPFNPEVVRGWYQQYKRTLAQSKA
ncbi:hypothetical protein WJX72_007607 [[Myrmecia] bisecta]|uniref:YTH domain-containing protein n=1 Tax=[Myrmecia] bisecta TaxID=41462 RepID=A0AAW1P3M6_9CHLO